MTSLHLDRLADIALTDKENEGTEQPFRSISGELSLYNVNFRYADNEPLLFDELSLSIKQGDNVAIIGASGTGKSTLMKLMLGLISPHSGKIEADGININHLGLRHYRQQVASVMQDDQLMSGTLAENISFFDPNMNMKMVAEAAVLAGIHDDISQMNMGYNSLVGDMGNALSGGQSQRLLLARALYRQPKILFLDEATSHLDVELEQYVSQAIQQLLMTRITIAHRPETIRSADIIYELRESKLVDVTRQYKNLQS
nr:ATP-binding cassette domain-containing protein [Opacimonas viscosa]